MTIQKEDNGKKGKFYISQNDKLLAEMTYTYAGSKKIIIDHTEVDVSLKGKGIGYKLVEASVEFARENDLKILPLCPFAKSVFDKKSDDYGDVL